jgi:hypothetical protein
MRSATGRKAIWTGSMALVAVLGVAVAVALVDVACGGNGGASTFIPGVDSGGVNDAGPVPSLLDAGGASEASASTILIVSPADTTLTVTAPGPTQQFTAMLQGSTAPVTATWSVDLPLVGTIASSGIFTASGNLGGLVTISAQTELAHGATTLTVLLQTIDNLGNVPVSAQGPLRNGGSADAKFRWLYPYDQTVFPRDLEPPVLQWDGEPATYALVHVTSTTIDYQAFYAASNPAAAALTQAAWTMITESAAPGDTLTIQATKMSASGVTGPITESWTIAQGSLKGTVYYNTYDSPLNNGQGAVMRVKPGENAQILLGGCKVCHAVSADGSTIVAMGALSDPAPDAGPPGNDPYFYKLGASYDLTNDAGVLHDEDDSAFAFGALYPDGSRMLSCAALPGNFPPNIPGLGFVGAVDGGAGDRPSKLYDPKTGAVLSAPGFDGVVTHALMPAFSPDGTRVVFNDYDNGAGHTLAVMDFAQAGNAFTNFTGVVGTPTPIVDGGVDAGADAGVAAAYLGWPYFLPDSKTVLYNTVDFADYATWNDYGGEPDHHGDLDAVDVASKTVTPLDAANGIANGVPYLPYGTAEAHLNYEPTTLPVAVGGYYWVVFTSRREYGNTITDANDPGHPDGGAGPFEAHPATRKKLWVAAIDINVTPGKDPSHPAFYLSGQEPLAGNMRGFWALDPCVQNGTSCASGDECCSGFCRQTSTADGGPVLSCVPQPQGCSQEFEKCATASDCCGEAQGYECLNGHCAQPAPK